MRFVSHKTFFVIRVVRQNTHREYRCALNMKAWYVMGVRNLLGGKEKEKSNGANYLT